MYLIISTVIVSAIVAKLFPSYSGLYFIYYSDY